MNKIFIESGRTNTNESLFIRTILNKFFNKSCSIDYELINTGGFYNLAAVKQKFEDSESDDDKNIVIFDADFKLSGGGFYNRKRFLLEEAQRLHVNFELFLFPNNAEDGMFESLLQKIVNPKYSKLLDFFSEYESKIMEFNTQLKEDVFETPDEKAKIYSYISAFKRSNREKESFKNKGDRDFANEKYWNLESSELNPLKDFLAKFF